MFHAAPAPRSDGGGGEGVPVPPEDPLVSVPPRPGRERGGLMEVSHPPPHRHPSARTLGNGSVTPARKAPRRPVSAPPPPPAQTRISGTAIPRAAAPAAAKLLPYRQNGLRPSPMGASAAGGDDPLGGVGLWHLGRLAERKAALF